MRDASPRVQVAMRPDPTPGPPARIPAGTADRELRQSAQPGTNPATPPASPPVGGPTDPANPEQRFSFSA